MTRGKTNHRKAFQTLLTKQKAERSYDPWPWRNGRRHVSLRLILREKHDKFFVKKLGK
jgi:hypothetical protein